MKATAYPIANAPTLPTLDLEFKVFFRTGIKLCYEKLFTLRKTEINYIIKYKEDLLTYSIPLAKDNETIVKIIKNIINERSFKYKCILFLNKTAKKSKKFNHLGNLIIHIIEILNSFINVEYSNL